MRAARGVGDEARCVPPSDRDTRMCDVCLRKTGRRTRNPTAVLARYISGIAATNARDLQMGLIIDSNVPLLVSYHFPYQNTRPRPTLNFKGMLPYTNMPGCAFARLNLRPSSWIPIGHSRPGVFIFGSYSPCPSQYAVFYLKIKLLCHQPNTTHVLLHT